jgi:hypothetical protein
MSKIYYNKDNIFIRDRIQHIKVIFKQAVNANYLKKLMENKIKFNEITEITTSSWISLVVKNEFFMKSNFTFHSAAIEYIKISLVK